MGYSSHYEGFGLPVLEAMTLHVPAIYSNNNSLPEVAGDIAVMIDTKDELAIADVIQKMTGNRIFRQELISKGCKQSLKFSWDRTDQEILKGYRTGVTGFSINN